MVTGRATDLWRCSHRNALRRAGKWASTPQETPLEKGGPVPLERHHRQIALRE